MGGLKTIGDLCSGNMRCDSPKRIARYRVSLSLSLMHRRQAFFAHIQRSGDLNPKGARRKQHGNDRDAADKAGSRLKG